MVAADEDTSADKDDWKYFTRELVLMSNLVSVYTRVSPRGQLSLGSSGGISGLQDEGWRGVTGL